MCRSGIQKYWEMLSPKIVVGIVVGIGFVTLILSLMVHWSANENESKTSTVKPSEETPNLYQFPAPIPFDQLESEFRHYNLHRRKFYNWGILGFGASRFFSYAAHFCKYEAEDGTIEVVSVGSDQDIVEKDIIAMYEKLFDKKLKITVVNRNSNFVNAHFRTVDDLIMSRPNVVGNCVLLLIWPKSEAVYYDNDIEAVRNLQPRALLTLYETASGLSGTPDFQRWLLSHVHRNYSGAYEDRKNPKLKSYTVDEYVHQEVNMKPSKEESSTTEYRPGGPVLKIKMSDPGWPALRLEMMRLKRDG